MFELITQYGDIVLCRKVVIDRILEEEVRIVDEDRFVLGTFKNLDRTIEVIKEISNYFVRNINNKEHGFYKIPLE